jgi:hypothetical protein
MDQQTWLNCRRLIFLNPLLIMILLSMKRWPQWVLQFIQAVGHAMEEEHLQAVWLRISGRPL